MPDLIAMELSRIIICEINDQQIVYLTEVDGERTFPILIGMYEAISIDRSVKREQTPRPMTHNLLKNLIEEMGGVPKSIVIHSLQDHTYYAMIRIERDGEWIEVDSRPSDAIALAVQFEPYLTIYVDEQVLKQAAN